MARPFKHEISILINEGRDAEARAKLKRAVRAGGGTIVGAMKVLGAPHAVVWRWVNHLGVASSYDGRAGAEAKHAKRRLNERIET